jgi:phosphoglycerate dehydrogenase-like enzyme
VTGRASFPDLPPVADANTRIAVASRSFSRHELLRRTISQRYETVTFNDAGASLSGSDLVEFLRGHEMAITALERLDAGLFEALPELTVVSKYGVGLDMIDLRAMDGRGVKLGWTAGINRRSVAELAIGMAIALLHAVPAATRLVREGGWKQIVGRQLSRRTVGVIGCGHVGKEVAMLARAFDCRVLSFDIREFPEFYARYSVEPVDLNTLLRESDVVTIHLPLDESTRHLLDATRLAAMKEDAVLVNLARGGIVDESSLAEALRTGKIAAAAVDVFEQEPPGDRTLIDLPNVLATPHIGGSTEEAILAMGLAAIAGLETARTPRDHGLVA